MNRERTIFLVRHASAGHRNNSDPTDAERQLDNKGRDQALRVAEQLKGKEVLHIVSSPLIRCVQTVEPLASVLGIQVETDPRYAELTPVEHAWQALEALVARLEEDSGTSGVICSHGDIIPDLLRLATMRGTRIQGRSGNAKASIWQMSAWNGATFDTALYFAPEKFAVNSAQVD